MSNGIKIGIKLKKFKFLQNIKIYKILYKIDWKQRFCFSISRI